MQHILNEALQHDLNEALHPIIKRLDRLTALATQTARLSAVVRRSLFFITIILILLISLEL
jgi:hypothetical protein